VLEETGFHQVQRRSRPRRSSYSARPTAERHDDLLLAPDQMILQINESIGHRRARPNSRDERLRGRSFVTPAMFGRYRYGSELLT